MSRIPKAYIARLRGLLQRAHARQLDRAVELLVAKARQTSALGGISMGDALRGLCEDLAARPYFRRAAPRVPPPLFFCDAGLGGLARWLRAAGYEAHWEAGIDDELLLEKARELSATVLTTDSIMMERRVLRDGLLPALWLPPTLKIPGQLALVFREFGLKIREPRCMNCGGELVPTDKQLLGSRIPPKTFRWLNEFFVCARCHKLFWRGTHWQRIQKQLRAVAGGL